jgi:pilus assembly protein CpaE
MKNDSGGASGGTAAQIAPLPRISVQAFCETQDLVAVMNAAAADRRMDKTHVKVHMGGVAAAIEAFRGAPTPNLIILETLGDRRQLIGQLESLADSCDPGTKVVVIGHENDISLYRDLISRGVSDYVVAPLDVLGFIARISELYTAAAEALGRIVAVTGAKGGVGASCVAHNLAWSIARGLQMQTVIADLDLPFGTAGLDFNQDPPQGIAEAVFAPDRVDANLIDRLLSKCSDQLSLLAAPATVERLYDLPESAYDAIIDVLRATSPCTLLDVPHQWSAWTRRMLVGADEVAIVAAPDLASLRNTKSLLDALRQARRHDAAPKIILNMVGVPRRPEIAPGDFAKAIEVDLAAIIPFEPKLFGSAANNGQMIAEVEAGSKIVETFDGLGRELMGRGGLRKTKNGLLAPLIERFARKRAG